MCRKCRNNFCIVRALATRLPTENLHEIGRAARAQREFHFSCPCFVSFTMGIQGLTKLISEHAPAAIKSHEISSYFGRKVAIDASMSIYQFMIAVRQQDGQMLTNEQGETTRYIVNLLGSFFDRGLIS